MKNILTIALIGWFFVAVEGAKVSSGNSALSQARVAVQVGPFFEEADCDIFKSLMLFAGGFDKVLGCWNSEVAIQPPGITILNRTDIKH